MSGAEFALNVVVVGLGQAGGKIAGEFYRRGYPSVALNTAMADLRALDAAGTSPEVPEEQRLLIRIGGFDGAGSDPAFGQACVRQHADAIRALVARESVGVDLVCLVAGLGGGTGSAVAELARVLQADGYPMVALTSLPSEAENAIIKVNAVRAIHDLASAPLKGWFIVDNTKLDALFRDAPMADYYTCINDAVVAPIDALNRLNHREDLYSLRSFDGEELRKLLLAGGLLAYNVADIEQLTEESLNDAVVQSLAHGVMIPDGFDSKDISYLAVVLEASAATLSRVPMSLIDRFHDNWKRETAGGAIEVGIYRHSQSQDTTKLRLLAISAALPAAIQARILEASAEADTVREKLGTRVSAPDVSLLDGMELLPSLHPPAAPRAEAEGAATGSSKRSSRRPHARIAATTQATPGAARRGAAAPAARGGGAMSVGKAQITSGASLAGKAEQGRTASVDRKVAGGEPTRSQPEDEPDRQAVAQGETGRSKVPGGGRGTGEEASDDGPRTEPPAAPEGAAAQAYSPILDELAAQVEVEMGSVHPPAAEDAPSPGLLRIPPPLPAGMAPLGAEAGSGEESYRRLSSDFHAAVDEGTRKQIIERLENDRCSENPSTRLLAVQSMARIDPELFESALVAATEDDNVAVRDAAVEALRTI